MKHTPAGRTGAIVLSCLTALMLAACDPQEATHQDASNPLDQPPIDSTQVSIPEETLRWGYRREGQADLDGDGSDERIILVADVQVDDARRPLWEDGHRWAVVVEDSSGRRSLAYSAFVPNGHVELALLRPADDGSRKLLVHERAATQLRDVEIAYAAGRIRTQSSAYYQTERWIATAP